MQSDWITTSTILSKLRDFDDRGAWERFVERFRVPIVRLAIGQGLKPADAEDVAQETLLAFADAYRAGRFDPEQGRLSRWLFGIAYRQILRCRAERGRRGAVEPQAHDTEHGAMFVADETEMTRAWDGEWERAILAQCIARARTEVHPVTFRAFELTVLENRDAAQAAAELSIDVKAVYNAKHRLLKRIRALRESMENCT